MKINAPFGWVGSKQRQLKHLLPIIEDEGTRIFLDVFGGSGSVLAAKKPSPCEVYNDADERLVDFFRVLRDDATRSRLISYAKTTPYSRAMYAEMKSDWIASDDIVKRAFALFYVQSFSFGGTYFGSFSISTPYGRFRSLRYWTSVEQLDDYAERFKNVCIESLDYRELIKRYDDESAFFYFDPPYLCSRKTFYRKDLPPVDHFDLVKALLELKGRAALSCYDYYVYEPLLEAGWKRKTFESRAYVAGKRDTDRRVETVYVKTRN